MNLAEIRKKSQQEKSGQKVAVPVGNASPPVEPPPPVEIDIDPLISNVRPPPEDVYEPPPQARPLPSLSEEAGIMEFDPLAVLLEGRERAGCDDEAFLEQTSVLESGARDSQELLCFRVVSEEYALNIMDIKEIIKPREVTEVPRVPAFVSGVLSLRGIIIPVFDMRIRLGLTDGDRSDKERIIVVKKGDEGFCGILVDEVIQVVRIEAKYLEPPPTVLEGIDRDFVNGIGRFDGRMLILLNMEKILDITLF